MRSVSRIPIALFAGAAIAIIMSGYRVAQGRTILTGVVFDQVPGTSKIANLGVADHTRPDAIQEHSVDEGASSVRTALTKAANANLRANHFLFSDSTDGWTASPGLYDYSFAADTGITMVNYPDYFTPIQVLNIAEKFIAAKNTIGEFPICLKKTGVAETFYSAWDLLHHHATGDGAFYVPQMEYLYYEKTRSTSAFKEDAPAMKTALSLIPVNHANGMVQILAEDQWVSWGFQDMVRKTGDDLMGSLLYYQAANQMAALYTAIGDRKNASNFLAHARRIQANLPEFLDRRDGMLYAALGQDKQIDIEGSAYAVHIGITNDSQAKAISTYLVKNYDKLTTRGYMRESPQDWAVCNYIHGGACHFGPGQYDNGAWSVANGWVAETLAKTDPALAVKFIVAFANSSDPTQEYWAWAGAAAPHKGQSLNLESPTGALNYVNNHPALFKLSKAR